MITTKIFLFIMGDKSAVEDFDDNNEDYGGLEEQEDLVQDDEVTLK